MNILGRILSRGDSKFITALLSSCIFCYALRRRRVNAMATSPASSMRLPIDNKPPLKVTPADPPTPVCGAEVGILYGVVFVFGGLGALTGMIMNNSVAPGVIAE
jgi:hypothetical protein